MNLAKLSFIKDVHKYYKSMYRSRILESEEAIYLCTYKTCNTFKDTWDIYIIINLVF